MPKAHRIVEGIKDALAGNITRVTIEGQTWVRLDSLIAAAPDMLAILKALVHPDVEAIVYFVPSDSWAQKLKDDVRAAIAKAEGQPLSTPEREGK